MSTRIAIWVFNCMRRGISYCHLTHKEETITQSNCNFIFFGPPRPLGKQTRRHRLVRRKNWIVDWNPQWKYHRQSLPIVVVVLLACCCDVGCHETETFESDDLPLSFSLIRDPQLSTQTWVTFIQRGKLINIAMFRALTFSVLLVVLPFPSLQVDQKSKHTCFELDN